MNIIKCVSAEIFKWNLGDCSNGGISSRFNSVLIPVNGGNLDVDIDNPPENLCRVVRRNIFGREYVHLEPWGLKGKCCMAGGTLVDSSDSRFREEIDNGGYAVSLHDRTETADEQRMYSI